MKPFVEYETSSTETNDVWLTQYVIMVSVLDTVSQMYHSIDLHLIAEGTVQGTKYLMLVIAIY
jgi:hypothetical protein